MTDKIKDNEILKLKEEICTLLKEVIYYQKMCSELLDEKREKEKNPSQIYLKIAR